MAQDPRVKEASTAGASNGEHEPHLVIRTAGSTLSNDGMVWNTTRSALYFTNRAWPDFTKLDLRRALHWYGSERRALGIQAGRPARNHKRLPTNDDPA
jgi:undecaprenyl diphosphate synthase